MFPISPTLTPARGLGAGWGTAPESRDVDHISPTALHHLLGFRLPVLLFCQRWNHIWLSFPAHGTPPPLHPTLCPTCPISNHLKVPPIQTPGPTFPADKDSSALFPIGPHLKFNQFKGTHSNAFGRQESWASEAAQFKVIRKGGALAEQKEAHPPLSPHKEDFGMKLFPTPCPKQDDDAEIRLLSTSFFYCKLSTHEILVSF